MDPSDRAACAFVSVGALHAFDLRPKTPRPGMEWIGAVPRRLMTFIGLCEMAGALALILPGGTGIAPWLTPLAGRMLSILMALAMLFHARRAGEGRNIALNFILFVLAAIVACGRNAVVPL